MKTTMAKIHSKPAPSKAKKASKLNSEAKEPKQRNEDGEKWSKSKKKRMRALKAKQQSTTEQKRTSEAAATIVSPKRQVPSQKDHGVSSKLQQAFKERLTGSRFRILNEELYTTPSQQAFERFSTNPALFTDYHEGFRHQVKEWPANPVDIIVQSLKTMANKSSSNLGVADFGCGDAALAKQLLKHQKNGRCPFTVHSFDLVASCELVTACDMAHTPMSAGSVDVAIFCLALMGTNLADFIREAHRVLKPSGILMIAEVRSRFETKGNDDELQRFLSVLEQLGFACARKDRSNKMFILLELRKNDKKPNKSLAFTAKPCIYKRR